MSRPHGEEAIREGDGIGELAVIDVAERLGNLGGSDELLGAAGGDAPKVRAVAADAGATLAQVSGNDVAARRIWSARLQSCWAILTSGSRSERMSASETS